VPLPQERAPDQALRHDYVATLASTSPLRSASSAYRYFASGDESFTRAKRHELVVVIRDFGQRATAPERFKYVVVPLAEESRDIERWDFWPWRVSPRYLNVLLPTILVLDCPHYDQRGYRSKRGSKDLSRSRVSNEVIPIERRGASEDCHPRIHVRPNASKVDVSETMHKTALSRSSFIGSSPARDDG